MTSWAPASNARPYQGGSESSRPDSATNLPDVVPKPSTISYISPDLAAKTALSALFAAGSALRFTISKRLAATLPQMTTGHSNNGPTLQKVTQ